MTQRHCALRFGGLLTVLLIALAPTARAGEEIVIGMSAAFTGPSRGLGIELYRGSMAYFEEVNRQGGVHGRKLVVKAYDDGYNPLPAISNTVKLIEQDKAFVLFDYVGTPTVTRILPLLKIHSDQSAFLFCPFTGAEPHRRPPYDQYVFNLRASYYEETGGLVDHFVEIGRKRIAIFYQIDAYGRNGWSGARAALKRRGLALEAEATYKRGAPFSQSMKAQVEILRAADPDAVICVGAYAACAALVRDCRDAGWDVPIANVSFVGSESLLALLIEAGDANGKDYTRNLVNSQVVPRYHRLDLPAVRDYRLLLDRHSPNPPAGVADPNYKPLSYSFVGFEGYLNARLLVEVLRKVGPELDRRRLREATESIRDLDLGIDVPASFGPDRHQGLNSVYYTVVQEGRFVPIGDWKRWAK
jgi:ABC-type branched-subunit amino acid transport system substrate-binding protein